MEGSSIHELINLKRPLVDLPNLIPPWPGGQGNPASLATVPVFICPSTLSNIPSDYGPYFAQLGFPANTPYITPRTDYVPLRGLHRSLAVCAGMPNADTHNAMLGTTDPITRGKVRFAETTDGLSNTICFVEKAGLQQHWFRGKRVAGSTYTDGGLGLNSYYGDWNVARHPRGYAGVVPANGIITPAIAQAPGCSNINTLNANNPYSFHPGGVQIVRGDGSVSFLSQTITNQVFAALVSRDGGEPISE